MIEVLDHDDDSCNDTRGRGKSLNYRVTHSYHCTALYPMTMMLVIVTKTNDDDSDVYHGCSYFHGCHSTIENCQPLKTCSHNLTTKAGQKIISAQFLPKVNWKWLPPLSLLPNLLLPLKRETTTGWQLLIPDTEIGYQAKHCINCILYSIVKWHVCTDCTYTIHAILY